MKPLNPYQGQAPAAMAQMGQGILEAGANIGRSLQQGYESLGQGIAGGISAVTDAYKQHKQDQAQYDATKKLYKAFESYLPEDARKKVQDIFADTTVSVAEKNKLSPMLFNMIGHAQQQAGRESIANIMAGNRLDVAAAKHPTPPSRQPFSPSLAGDPLDLPVEPSPASPSSLQAKTRMNPVTGKMEFWSPEAKRFIEEPNQ